MDIRVSRDKVLNRPPRKVSVPTRLDNSEQLMHYFGELTFDFKKEKSIPESLRKELTESSHLHKPITKDQVIDTLDIAREKFPGTQNSLDALCKRFRIDNSKRIKHTALIDCELLSKVYVNLIDQKEPKLNFLEKKDDMVSNKNLNINFCKNIIKPTSNELKEHQNFLKKSLKKNYF